MLTKIHILPLADTVYGIEGDLSKNCLIPYFKDAYRPVKKGDIFIVKGSVKDVEFRIVASEPSDLGIVGPNTILDTEGGTVEREGSNLKGFRSWLNKK